MKARDSDEGLFGWRFSTVIAHGSSPAEESLVDLSKEVCNVLPSGVFMKGSALQSLCFSHDGCDFGETRRLW